MIGYYFYSYGIPHPVSPTIKLYVVTLYNNFQVGSYLHMFLFIVHYSVLTYQIGS